MPGNPIQRMRRLLDELEESEEMFSRAPGPSAEAAQQLISRAASYDGQDAVTGLLQGMLNVTGTISAAISLLDTKQNILVFWRAVGEGSRNLVGQAVPLKGSAIGLAYATGQTQLSNTLYQDISQSTGVAYGEVIASPLVLRDRTVGVIGLAANTETRIDPGLIDALEPIAKTAAYLVQYQLLQSDLDETLRGLVAPDLKELCDKISRLADTPQGLTLANRQIELLCMSLGLESGLP